ncbi:MAG: hypothetical protein SGJ02_02210 [bacterium]|nr:hypothetical protein [bacterium]
MIRNLSLTLLSQASGFLAGVSTGFLFSAGANLYPLIVLTLHASIAGLIAKFLRLSNPWIALNLILPIGLLLATFLSLSYTLLTLLTLFVLLLYIPTFFYGVPYYPTHPKAYQEILKLLPEDSSDHFLDLGSGFGALLKFLAVRRPNMTFIGVEVSPLAWFVSKITLLPHSNIKIQFKDFWQVDLSGFKYVYAFLAPGPMPRLWQKAKAELSSGTIFITNTFEVDYKPSQEIQIDDLKQTSLKVFVM